MPEEAKTVVMCVCPLCGINRCLDKRGTDAARGHKFRGHKPRIRFDIVDPETAPFIDIRKVVGGKKTKGVRGRGKAPGGGFPRIDSIPLAKVKDLEEYSDLIHQIKDQISKIQKVLQ